MFAAVGTIIMILTTIVPLVFTAVKAYPRIKAILSFLFRASTGGVGAKSGVVGILLFIFTFVGGFGFFLGIYFGWGLEVYLWFLDFIFTPFGYIAEHFIAGFVSQLPSLPPSTASALCLFDFSRIFTLLVTGFCFEVYLRVVIHFLMKRF